MKDYTMDISSVANVQSITAYDQNKTRQEAGILVLKKAMDMQKSGVTDLLNALPTELPLASSGTLGTQLNTLA